MIYALEIEVASWAVNTFLILLGVALVLCAVMVIIEIISTWRWL